LSKSDDDLWTLILAPIGGVIMMGGLVAAITSPFVLLIMLADWLGIAGWVVAAMFPLGMLILCIDEKLQSRRRARARPLSD
jgi:hypothetical protein